MPVTNNQLTGQITVTTTGTAVQGPNVLINGSVYLKGLAGNTGLVYYGNNDNGDVDTSTGFELSPGEKIVVDVGNLNELWFDAATSGDKLCWSKI